MSELEKILRSWTPRHPSPAVKRRILTAVANGPALCSDDEPETAEGFEYTPFRLGWFAPATLSLLLACVLFNHHNSFVLSDSGGGGPLVAAALSNQSAAAWLPGSFQHAQNSLPVDAFEWTNVSRRGASGGPN